jgi:hypothetical protein
VKVKEREVMSFTGKATYGPEGGIPELAEDVADIVGIVSPHETPLLDHLGDARVSAQSTLHEWLEDELLPNTDAITSSSFSPSPTTATSFTVANSSRFREGDLVRPGESSEVMLVQAVSGSALAVTRGYGGTSAVTLAESMALTILGNAALEGADKSAARFTTRQRKQNYTQIFASTVEVSGSQLASRKLGVADEMEYQKQERLRELLRDLENCVINGVAPAATPEGSSSVRRTMNGILHQVSTNEFAPGLSGIPEGDGAGADLLTEPVLNASLRSIWEQSSGTVDTILVNGQQKRRINSFLTSVRGYEPSDTAFRDMVSVYESDFGVCRVVLSRWMPADTVLLLDSSRVSVLPLSGRAFHFKQLASTGDAECGQVLGEYTLQLMNENAHGKIVGLGVA